MHVVCINFVQEQGIYGIDGDCDQHKAQYYNTDCQAIANAQTVSALRKIAEPPGNSISITMLWDLLCFTVNVENMLIKFGDEVKSHWYKFGEAIGVPRDYLSTLSGENESQCLKNVLDYWLRHYPGQPTWEEVAEAHRKIKFVDQIKLTGNEDYIIGQQSITLFSTIYQLCILLPLV